MIGSLLVNPLLFIWETYQNRHVRSHAGAFLIFLRKSGVLLKILFTLLSHAFYLSWRENYEEWKYIYPCPSVCFAAESLIYSFNFKTPQYPNSTWYNQYYNHSILYSFSPTFQHNNRKVSPLFLSHFSMSLHLASYFFVVI